MIFNGKYDYNVQFKRIGKTKQCEWSYDCLRISENVMFTKMSAKKGIKLFKEHIVAAIVK